MGINKATNDFLSSLLDLIYKSGLPPCNVRLCLDVARGQVMDLERAEVQREIAADAAKTQPGGKDTAGSVQKS